MKQFVSFSLKTIVSHTVTYFIAGAIAYPLLTKPFYVGANPIFSAFWRTEADPVLWAHVTTWFIPAQLLRGLLLSFALFPFYNTLINWSYAKRFLVITGLYLVFGFWAAAVAAPGTIEGLVYMRPEVALLAHLKVQPEIIGQGIAFGAWLSAWMAWVQKPRPVESRARL